MFLFRDMSRKVNLVSSVFAMSSFTLLCITLASDKSVFVLRDHFEAIFDRRGVGVAIDGSYAMGAVKDTLGSSWGSSQHLFALEGCDQHTVRGEVAQWVTIAATVASGVSSFLHASSVCFSGVILRMAAVSSTGMVGMLCGVALWAWLSLYSTPLGCTRMVTDDFGTRPVDFNVLVSDTFRLQAAVPFLVMCCIFALATFLASAAQLCKAVSKLEGTRSQDGDDEEAKGVLQNDDDDCTTPSASPRSALQTQTVAVGVKLHMVEMAER